MMTGNIDFTPEPPPARAPSPGDLTDHRQPLVAWSGTLEQGFSNAPHAHRRAQLLLCYSGLIRLWVETDSWFVPARHGVWIPPGTLHRITTQTPARVHNLFTHARYIHLSGLPAQPIVVRATPLLRGIARRLSAAPPMRPDTAQSRRLAWVALDEMARLERPDLSLPGGRDPRLVAALSHLITHPQDRQGLPRTAAIAGTSPRTLARLFLSETGLSFRDWRGRMRMLLAMEALEKGATSTDLAARLGYSSPSAFIAAFHKQAGAPPSAFRPPS